MKTLSLSDLKTAGACSSQVALFRKLFGTKPVEVTEALCIAHASEFSWGWAAAHFLSAPAWKAYAEAYAPAQKAYNEACASAWKAYAEACAAAQKAYDEAYAAARKAYDEAYAPARKAYDEACAPAFARAFNS